MSRLFTFCLLLLSIASIAYAQPQVDWAHRISAVDSLSFQSLGIIDVDVDMNGNLLLTGSIRDAFDLDSDGKGDISLKGRIDLFVASYSPGGALNWATTANADSFAVGFAVTSDAEGNVYINGEGTDLSDLDRDGLPDLTTSERYTTFLAKYNANGELLWAQPYETPMAHPSELLFNEQTNELISSGTDASICQESDQPSDCYLFRLRSQFNVASYTPDGQLNWTFLGNQNPADRESHIDIQRLTLAQNGDLHIGGLIRGPVDIDPTDSLPEITGDNSGFVGGSVYWATLSKERALLNQQVLNLPLPFIPGMDMGQDGSLYLSTGFGEGSPTDSTQLRGHIMHLNKDNTPQWTHFFARTDTSHFTSLTTQIDTDTQSNVYITGLVNGRGDLDSDNMNDIPFAPASQHAFFAKYEPSGTLDWVLMFDHQPFTTSSSQGQWIATRDGSSVYAIAAYRGTADPDGPGPFPPVSDRNLRSLHKDLLLLRITDASTNTSTEGPPSPQNALLSAPYPNPFTTQTSFSLHVNQTQHVVVEMYNILGQRLRTLYEGIIHQNEPHSYTIEVGDLPSGLYVIHANGEHFQSTQNVLKVR